MSVSVQRKTASINNTRRAKEEIFEITGEIDGVKSFQCGGFEIGNEVKIKIFSKEDKNFYAECHFDKKLIIISPVLFSMIPNISGRMGLQENDRESKFSNFSLTTITVFVDENKKILCEINAEDESNPSYQLNIKVDFSKLRRLIVREILN